MILKLFLGKVIEQKFSIKNLFLVIKKSKLEVICDKYRQNIEKASSRITPSSPFEKYQIQFRYFFFGTVRKNRSKSTKFNFDIFFCYKIAMLYRRVTDKESDNDQHKHCANANFSIHFVQFFVRYCRVLRGFRLGR